LWGDAIIAILGTIAKQERVRIVERVRAGLQRAQVTGTRSGKPIGRPPVVFDRAQVVRRRAAGESWRDIAAALSTRTARRVYEQGSVAKPLIRETGPSDVMKRVAGA